MPLSSERQGVPDRAKVKAARSCIFKRKNHDACDIVNCSFIDEKRLDEFERILIKENDVLMCLTGGTIGKIIKVGKVDESLVQNYRVGHFSPLNNNIIKVAT